jgi:CO/xanthine dehydrogenase Mo-binding subunit
VLTGEDFPRRFGGFVKDEEVLALHRVRYFGEPVAVVAADDPAMAQAALALIEVDYDELPALMSPDEALAAGAAAIHEHFGDYVRRFAGTLPNNVCAHTVMSEGDVAAGFASAEVIVEGSYETQPQVHCYMEPCGALAELDDNGRVVIWSACQAVHRVQATTAEILGLSMSDIRAVATRVGGAFGGKSDVTVQPVAALLALRTRKPVKLVLPRNDDFLMMRTRHPARIWMRTGALRDGTLIAREARVVMDGGAYAEDSSAVLGFSVFMTRGPYRIANIRSEGTVAYTNRLRAAGFRGYGNPQMCFAGESQLDELADKLDMDPLDLRLKNAMVAGDVAFGGERIGASGLVECLERIREATRWKERRVNYAAAPAAGGPRRGLGISCVAHVCGILSTSAIVKVLEDGTVSLNCGAVDLGQGSGTVLIQMCAQTLGVPPEQVSFAPPDTDASPYNWSTGGSRVTHMVGRAVSEAASDACKKVLEHAAQILKVPEEALAIRGGGRIGVIGDAGRETTLRMVSRRAHWEAGGPIIGVSSLMFEGGGFDPERTAVTGTGLGHVGIYVFGAQVAEVEVDPVTGQAKVLKFWAAHDVGCAINPAGVRGQIVGGVAQGIGFALFEDLRFDGGIPANPNLMDYKIPSSMDMPEIEAIIVEHAEPTHPFGAKGVGEPPIVGVAPAVANALFNAAGVRLRRLPLTPERVLAAIDERDGNGEAAGPFKGVDERAGELADAGQAFADGAATSPLA